MEFLNPLYNFIYFVHKVPDVPTDWNNTISTTDVSYFSSLTLPIYNLHTETLAQDVYFFPLQNHKTVRQYIICKLQKFVVFIGLA